MRADFITFILTIFISQLSYASPVGRLVAGPEEVIKRLDSVNVGDVGKLALKTPVGAVVTEPIMKLLWASSLFSETDWIGMQALLGMHGKIDPGGKDDGSNMFVYTCKAGWIDLGHVIYSALGYKLVSMGLRGNSLVQKNLKSFLPEKEAKFFIEVADMPYREGILSSPEFKASV